MVSQRNENVVPGCMKESNTKPGVHTGMQQHMVTEGCAMPMASAQCHLSSRSLVSQPPSVVGLHMPE